MSIPLPPSDTPAIPHPDVAATRQSTITTTGLPSNPSPHLRSHSRCSSPTLTSPTSPISKPHSPSDSLSPTTTLCSCCRNLLAAPELTQPRGPSETVTPASTFPSSPPPTAIATSPPSYARSPRSVPKRPQKRATAGGRRARNNSFVRIGKRIKMELQSCFVDPNVKAGGQGGGSGGGGGGGGGGGIQGGSGEQAQVQVPYETHFEKVPDLHWTER
ncbi:hypothetical protein P152DRAFT_481893 [Eremomyces bilateralis CBS 781.70]|uniref:Uncharacterized protein n=1 Tax=Eremomyces bilateralis CBS 781.70 TaxID=1392243 RepID=A0A6G1G509_9PEZI|nr:uncharacterized protein P152DRAFT_481893 [Eremomyces bilateralis CBS 781.70]KAF1813021.1 hypothetical protein P152DRAFT_481893 [Eremomyces bilateralis CBS 781.70]